MSTSFHTAMVLAAGKGTRLKPITDTLPKPLVNVGGVPVIIRSLVALKQAGIRRAVINTHYFAGDLERAVTARVQQLRLGLDITFSREEELLETGGGLKKALPLLGEAPFVVVNSDAVWLEADYPLLPGLMSAFNTRAHDVLMAVVPTASTLNFRSEGGDFTLHKTTHVLTRPADRAAADVVYAGIHITHPALFAQAPTGAFSLNAIWNPLLEQQRLHGHLYHGPWVDMGTPVGLEVARALVQSHPLVT
jgi:N-acetyl-alpha-D-muramate 1-phosphate uridylyltransferase